MNQQLHDLIAPYALDALEDDERDRFQRHLAECAQCSAQLAELEQTVAALAYAAEGPIPPPALRGRILDSARGHKRASVFRFPARNWAFRSAATVAAVAACLAIGLGLWAASLSRSLDRERGSKSAYARATQLLAAKPAVRPLVGAKGSLLVADDGRAAIVVCGLDRAPSGRSYEAWVIRGKTPRPAGLFRAGSGCTPFVLKNSVSSGSTVAVTLERAGGAAQPTGQILFHAETA